MTKKSKSRLQIEREKLHLTQIELADELNEPRDKISRWERGTQLPRPEALRKLTAYFGVSVDETWFRKEGVEEVSSPSRWNVPYRRNPYFIGDEARLVAIREQLVVQKENVSIVTISGIGGIGKTQLALEYAYQYIKDYHAIFWISADTDEQIDDGLVGIGKLLQLPEARKRKLNQAYLINEVQRWFRQHPDWLLILDNVTEHVKIKQLLLALEGGHVLLTTRTQSVANVASNVLQEKMQPEEGALLLLHRSHLLPESATLEEASIANRKEALVLALLLDGLPLALDQAAAYIKETQCSLSSYRQLYDRSHKKLLEQKSMYKNLYSDYDESVATTWIISFTQIQQSVAAYDLLCFCAFLQADFMPENLLVQGLQSKSSENLNEVDTLLAFNRACQVVLNFSFLRRNAADTMFSMHRLVQLVLKDRMDEQIQQQWRERFVRTMDIVFSKTPVEQMEMYLPQARACARLIKKTDMQGREVAHLLEQVANAVRDRGWYAQARPLYLQAFGAAREQFGQGDPHVLDLMLDTVRAHMDIGEYGLAIIVCKHLRSDYERIQGKDSPDVVKCLNYLALAQVKQGMYPAAIETCEQALNWYTRVQKPDSLERAMTYQIVADLCLTYNKIDEAKAYYQAALKIREQILGPEHPEVANSLADMGLFYLRQNDVEKSESFLQRAMTIRKKALGNDHPDVAMCLEYLAVSDRFRGNYKQAEERCQEALAIRQQKLGHYHPDIAQNLEGLAVLFADQGNAVEAEQYYREALEVYLRVGGPESQKYLFAVIDFADFLREQGRGGEAEIYDQKIASTVKLLKTKGPLLSFELHNNDEDDEAGPTQIWNMIRPG